MLEAGELLKALSEPGTDMLMSSCEDYDLGDVLAPYESQNGQGRILRFSDGTEKSVTFDE